MACGFGQDEGLFVVVFLTETRASLNREFSETQCVNISIFKQRHIRYDLRNVIVVISMF